MRWTGRESVGPDAVARYHHSLDSRNKGASLKRQSGSVEGGWVDQMESNVAPGMAMRRNLAAWARIVRKWVRGKTDISAPKSREGNGPERYNLQAEKECWASFLIKGMRERWVFRRCLRTPRLVRFMRV